MAGRGMSLASIISASQSGAAQAMSMAEQERNKNPDYDTTPGKKKTLDPAAQAPGTGESLYNQQSMLLNQMELGGLMADIYGESSVLANLITSSGPNAQLAFQGLPGNR